MAYRYGLYGYGLYRDGLVMASRYGLYSYGLYSYGWQAQFVMQLFPSTEVRGAGLSLVEAITM